MIKLDFRELPKEWQSYIEQISWERDMAIEQLESYGVGFGEKADVVRIDAEDFDKILKQEMAKMSCDFDALCKWFVSTVFNPEKPIWTEDCLIDLHKNFYVIPR